MQNYIPPVLLHWIQFSSWEVLYRNRIMVIKKGIKYIDFIHGNTLRQGTKGVSTTEYGRKLMLDMMRWFTMETRKDIHLVGHGYKI